MGSSPFSGHRLEETGDVFLRVAKGLLAIEQADGVLLHGVLVDLDRVEILQLVLRGFQPLFVGLCVGEIGLQLLVLDDAAFLEVDQQHAARLQAPFADDLVLAERQHAAFGGEADEIVLRHAIARRPQAVAVQRGGDLAAIGKGDGGRAVPRLHQRGVVFVERAALRIHQVIAVPRFGDQHHHRSGQGCIRSATSSSSALSRQAVSDWPCGTIGHSLSRSAPSSSLSIVRRRAFIQLTLPRTVLISPLWQARRNGWARRQLGKVLVEKRWCTRPSALSQSGSRRSS